MSQYAGRRGRKRQKDNARGRHVTAKAAKETTTLAPIADEIAGKIAALDAALSTRRHCDEYIDDETQPAALRAWLEHARSPAHGYLRPKPWPVLFADWVDRGGTVQLVMASRFGDVGVTRDLSADPEPYEDRVHLDLLTNFRDELAPRRSRE